MTQTGTTATRQMLTISTTHLPATLAANLDTTPGVTGAETPFGYLMQVPFNPITAARANGDIPDVITAVLSLARLAGCDMVVVSPDGDLVELPTWNGDNLIDDYTDEDES